MVGPQRYPVRVRTQREGQIGRILNLEKAKQHKKMGLLDNPGQEVKTLHPQVHLRKRINLTESLRREPRTLLDPRRINLLPIQE